MALGLRPLEIVAKGTYPLLTKADHWERVALSDVANVQNGFAFKSSHFDSDRGVPLIRIRDVFRATTEHRYWGEFDERYIVQAGDILIGMDGDFAVSRWAGDKALLNQRVCKVMSNSDLFDEGFLWLCLQPFLDAINAETSSVTVKHLSSRTIEEIPLPLPPLKEQRRVVAKIEELFFELDKGVESLKTARAKLDVYRQAVLKYAFEGKLTAQWRENNKDTLEKPDQLLARIRQEREARYGQQLQEWNATLKIWEESEIPGKRPAKPPKLKEISHPSLTETETLPSLAAGWSYLRLGLVIDEPKYGSSKKCDYDYEGTAVLRIPNVVRGVVDTSDLKGTHFEDDEKRAYGLRSGDILTIRSNGSISIVGRCALISKLEEQYLYAGYLIRLRSNLGALLPEYLAALLSSHLLRTQIEYKAKSTSGVNNINSGEIQSLIVPLCSLSEQKVVVERLSASLSAIDAIEAEIENQLQKADALRQSVLKKAFAGQLAPQDSHDEPASVLLDRIRAKRGETVKNNHAKRSKRKKAAA